MRPGGGAAPQRSGALILRLALSLQTGVRLGFRSGFRFGVKLGLKIGFISVRSFLAPGLHVPSGAKLALRAEANLVHLAAAEGFRPEDNRNCCNCRRWAVPAWRTWLPCGSGQGPTGVRAAAYAPWASSWLVSPGSTCMQCHARSASAYGTTAGASTCLKVGGSGSCKESKTRSANSPDSCTVLLPLTVFWVSGFFKPSENLKPLKPCYCSSSGEGAAP